MAVVHFNLSNDSEKAIDSLAMLAESLGMDTIELSNMLLKLQQEQPQEIAAAQQHIGDKEILSSEYRLLQQKYDDLGVEETTLTKMQELENQADAAESQCRHQQMKLESFAALPSDMVLASIKIQEAEDDLHQLEQVRETLLSEIADSVH
ncbi:hypothetical protein MUCCIDRAFT_166312 [Mucor lusitanicus CBS 277.49]|uniref:Uncharacterized protein n=1 Tax=Mucor lusitanicus CBS 277.49 TaxID=747725 RepID=A0A168IYX0_MUCCL|nr:hypothetical protein MUCCIDRAFT_166312 [Mucor lusitanicus CBS 277.49]